MFSTLIYQLLNKFKVLGRRVMNEKVSSEREIKNDRKTILKKEKLKKERRRKKEKPVKARKIEEGELLREVIVKIGLEKIDIRGNYGRDFVE